MTDTVMIFDRVNTNNRVYSPSEVKFESQGHVVFDVDGPQDSVVVPVDKIIGSYSNMRVEGDRLVCEIALNSTPMADVLREKIAGKSMSFVTSGTGDVETLDDGVVKVVGFELTSLFPTDNSAWVDL